MIFQSTMSLRSLFLCTLLVYFHPIFGPHASAAAAAAGTLKLYDDYNCEHPSTLNPVVNLTLSTCLVTPGGEGVVIAELPQCPQSTATLIYYTDAACGTQSNSVSASVFSENCFTLAEAPTIYDARAVMFSCQDPANNPLPSSTTTAVVSALAAVATGSTDNSGSGSSSSGSGSSSSTSAAGSTPTDASTQKHSTDSSGSNTSASTSASTSTSTSTTSRSGSGSGLDTGDIIALAVGLGIGSLTIAIMLATWLLPNFRLKLKKWFSRTSPFPRNKNDWPYTGAQEMDSQQQPLQR